MGRYLEQVALAISRNGIDRAIRANIAGFISIFARAPAHAIHLQPEAASFSF